MKERNNRVMMTKKRQPLKKETMSKKTELKSVRPMMRKRAKIVGLMMKKMTRLVAPPKV